MIRFDEPLAGTVFCLADEMIARGFDRVDCVLKAESGHELTVNGIPCHEEANGQYRVSIPFSDEKRLELIAKDHTADETTTSYVFRVTIRKKIFRVSVDDNIWCLQDIAQHADTYKSIFDCPYFALYKKLHDEYGACFHFNIFYTCPEHGGFSLPEMPDRFRDEWLSIRSFMDLSFHARQNEPDYPYANATYDEVYRDCKAVNEEIYRFAGYYNPVTTMHFVLCPPEGVRALYDCGTRALLGYYCYDKDHKPHLCYYADQKEFDAVRKYGFYKNPNTSMMMFACDSVLNCTKPELIPAEMDEFNRLYPNRSFIDMLIHEEYFYKDYKRYLPDYEQRLRAGIEWALAHGYHPGLVRDIFDFNDPVLFGKIQK